MDAGPPEADNASRQNRVGASGPRCGPDLWCPRCRSVGPVDVIAPDGIFGARVRCRFNDCGLQWRAIVA